MTKKTKLVWRLGKLPTVAELDLLIRSDTITKEEAREVLFSSETEDERDKKSLESEIKFLRELVEKLSQRSEIITTIREIEVPYKRHPWWRPYEIWCSSGDALYSARTANSDSTSGTTIDAMLDTAEEMIANFSKIKTF